jgi:hypothetical protein
MSKTKLSNYVGGINDITSNTTTNVNSQMIQQHNNQFETIDEQQNNYFTNNPNVMMRTNNNANRLNTSLNESDASSSPSNAFKQQLNQLRLMKRRSITSSPIRYNYNSKSSPPVTKRVIENTISGAEGTTSTSSKRSVSAKSPSSKKMPTKHFDNLEHFETISTDSDIGTSPSATTLANSPPSSPQQAQSLLDSYELKQHSSKSLNNAIVRQHSYLNAVQLSDYKQQQQQSSTQSQAKLRGVLSRGVLNNIKETNDESIASSDNYYYSPSATLIREKNQQYQQSEDVLSTTLTKAITSENIQKNRSKSSGNQKQAASAYRSAQSLDDDSQRINSYLNSSQSTKQQQQSAQFAKQTAKSSNPRNTSIKKLKSFFGDKAPMVLQAVENKNIIASDEFLTTLLETVKEGVLNCKIVCKDGKRSHDRSWRPAWAVLKKSGALFLCKEKKDNIMIPSVDSYPINLKNSTIDIAYDYTKRKNVFKVTTFSNSEYLFQTIDYDSMIEWIKAMQENSTPPDLEKLLAESYNKSKIDENNKSQQWSMNSMNNSSNSLNDAQQNQTMKMANNYYNKSNSSERMTVSSSPDDTFALSPMQRSKLDDISPRRQDTTAVTQASNAGSTTNRKWVRQMTRRIKDFMTNTSASDDQQQTHGQSSQHNLSESPDNLNRNFGVALDKCESSSTSPYVPVVIEVCTRLIELHINDEGIYRKVGQKQVVNSLRAQLNQGILNIDISDFNWDNPHSVVSLLKCFLNELPDSLTTSNLYSDFIQVCRIDHHQIRLMAIRKLLRKLPVHNFEALKYLSAHLRRVAAAYQHNKMTIKNLCIAFSQSIVRHKDANCETIRLDHVAQSLLIELIIIYVSLKSN